MSFLTICVLLFLVAFVLMHFQRSETDRLAHLIATFLFGVGAVAAMIYFGSRLFH